MLGVKLSNKKHNHTTFSHQSPPYVVEYDSYFILLMYVWYTIVVNVQKAVWKFDSVRI